MKRYLLSVSIVTLGLLGFGLGQVQAATTTNGLLSTFAIVGLFSPTNSPVMITNTIGNIITSTYTAKPVKIATKDILNLLGAEFGASFPSGAQLAYSLHSPQGFVVLDSSGNVVRSVATNPADGSYRFSLTNSSSSTAISGKAVQTKTTASTNTVENVTETVSDYAIYYADGKGNNLHFTGVIVLKVDALVTSTNTTYQTVSILLSGAGGGTFFNPADGDYDQGAFPKATWTAAGKNVTQ